MKALGLIQHVHKKNVVQSVPLKMQTQLRICQNIECNKIVSLHLGIL